jgi:choline dehydrogenase-like flavoprotein
MAGEPGTLLVCLQKQLAMYPIATFTSPLPFDCLACDVDNQYVVDGSLLISSGAVNPALTTMANSPYVGDPLPERLPERGTHHDPL